MKKFLYFVSITIGTIILIYMFPIFRATRTEDSVNKKAFSIITKWQTQLRDNSPFDYTSFSLMFTSKDVLSEINLYEEKIRKFYNISSENKISGVGELMKIQKKRFLLHIDKDNFFPVTKYTPKKRYWHWLYGVFIPTLKENNKIKDYAFIRLGYDCRIDITESFIGENSFITLLGIDDNGRILDPDVEKIFKERMNST